MHFNSLKLAFSSLTLVLSPLAAAQKPDEAFEKAQTARLVAQMAVLDPAVLTQYTPNPQAATDIYTDDDLIRYSAMHIQGSINLKDYEDAKRKKTPFSLIRTGIFNALTLAIYFESRMPKGIEYQTAVRNKYSHLLSNCSLRTNCYSYAMGDYCSNPLFKTADPGKRDNFIADIKDDPVSYIKGIIADGASFAGTDPAHVNIPAGQRLIALYYKERPIRGDYHVVRFDKSEDGQMLVSSKFGVVAKIHSNTTDNIYQEMRYNYANPRVPGYQFKAFFTLPVGGIDVGQDGYMRRTGELTDIPLAEITAAEATKGDVEVFRHIFMRQTEEQKPAPKSWVGPRL